MKIFHYFFGDLDLVSQWLSGLSQVPEFFEISDWLLESHGHVSKSTRKANIQ